MTFKSEYKNSDSFRRKLMREIRAGNRLIKSGFPEEELPANVHTLKSVLIWYDKFLKESGGRTIYV